MRKLKRKLRDIKYGIQSIWYYLPIIWRSRDWDYVYTDELYLHSLKRLFKGLEKRQHHIVPKKFFQQMHDVKNLMEKQVKDDYWYNTKTYQDLEYNSKRDREYLHKLILKHREKWWD